MNKKNPLLFALFGVGISLIIVEIIIRVGLVLTSKPPSSDRPTFYYMPENAKTMQDASYPNTKPTNVFRITVIGDSFSYGPHIQYDDTFSKRLERMLALNQVEEKGEVINFGSSGLSTKNELGELSEAFKKNPDLILLQITLNDPELRRFNPEGGKAKYFGPLVINPKTHPLLYYWKTAGFIANRIHNTQSRYAYINYFLGLFEEPETWKNFSDSLNEFVKRTAEKKIPFVAVVFPVFTFPFNDIHPFIEIHKKINALLDELKVPHLDLFNAYKNMDISRLQVIPIKDIHPNEIAHRIAAEKIYAWLASENFIPQSLIIKNTYRGRTEVKAFENWKCKDNPKGLTLCNRQRRSR